MKHIQAGINFWAGFDTVSTSKFEKMEDLKKSLKEKRKYCYKKLNIFYK